MKTIMRHIQIVRSVRGRGAKFKSVLQHKMNGTAGGLQFHFLLLNHNDLILSQCYFLLKYQETT
jgi:hypothetical protein